MRSARALLTTGDNQATGIGASTRTGCGITQSPLRLALSLSLYINILSIFSLLASGDSVGHGRTAGQSAACGSHSAEQIQLISHREARATAKRSGCVELRRACINHRINHQRAFRNATTPTRPGISKDRVRQAGRPQYFEAASDQWVCSALLMRTKPQAPARFAPRDSA